MAEQVLEVGLVRDKGDRLVVVKEQRLVVAEGQGQG
jgi:hypothetical protein